MKSSQNFRIKSIKSNQQSSNQYRSLQMSLTCKSLTNRDIKQIGQFQKSVIQIQPRQVLQKQSSINCRQSLVSVSESQVSVDEEFEIWDNNQDLRLKKLVIEERKPSVGQFLQLYKARYGGFPGYRQQIQNEEVIKVAITHASSSKQLFKKYFPKKQIVFEDDHDYSQPYNIEDDQHFKSFNRFFRNKKLQSNLKIPSQNQINKSR
ncbi:unnamed protein product [Paramecium sonneborni]|uniref:Uncharacterized protein n=1 Tax=Paramecium sonneborni TaxID=65129 RepID=A0A8S1QCY8_9CILI|nr:unnamed protein product [Paramecium sonneborni]